MGTIADYVQQWGNATSIAFFDPTCQFFRVADLNGIIGYRKTATHAIVFGDPVCPSDTILPLTHAFHEYTAQRHLKVIYIASSIPFTHLMLEHNLCSSAIGLGNEIILDVACDPKLLPGAKAGTLRTKWRFSLRNGLSMHEYIGNDLELEQQFELVRQAWLTKRKGLQIYLAPADIFEHRAHRRWFYAHYQENIVGIIILNKIDMPAGYVLTFLMLAPDAPATTSEFLIMSVLDQLRKEQIQHLSIGMIPCKTLQHMYGLGKVSSWLAYNIYALSQKAFKLHRKEQYWKKFAPQKKELFVAFQRGRMTLRDVWNIMHALNVVR